MLLRRAQLALVAVCAALAITIALGLHITIILGLTGMTVHFYADTSRWRENGRFRAVALVPAASLVLTWVVAWWVYFG